MVQVVNVDDLTQILGKRPYTTVESRNIDKFRDGFDKATDADIAPERTPNSMGGSGEGSGSAEAGPDAPGDVQDGKDAPKAPPSPTAEPGGLPGIQTGPVASGRSVAS